MISLDTNVVLRFLLDDVPSQTKAVKRLITSTKCYVTDAVVIEVIYVLEKALMMGRKDVTWLVKDFLNLPNVAHNEYFLEQSIDLYAARPALSIVDCYATAEAETYGNRLYTFDKQLARAGGPHVVELV